MKTELDDAMNTEVHKEVDVGWKGLGGWRVFQALPLQISLRIGFLLHHSIFIFIFFDIFWKDTKASCAQGSYGTR